MNGDNSRLRLIFSNKTELPISETRTIGRADFEGKVEDELKLYYISREQIKIYVDGKGAEIEELETSKNGTWLISGGRVTKLEKGKRYRLNEGDEINFSMSVTVKVGM